MTPLPQPLRTARSAPPRRRLPRATLSVAAAAVALLALALLALACSGRPGADATARGSAAHYQVRGQVTAVPAADDPTSNLVIRHEAIDDFQSMDGEVVGMDSMAMPFPVADGASLAGIAPGDKVSFTLEVDWDGDPAYQITRIEKLPADTEIEYGKAHPPAAAGDAAQQH